MYIKIGVYGSAVDTTAVINKRAFDLGVHVAENNAAIITGACPGLPLFSVQGAKSNKGYSIGFSATCNIDDHKALLGTSTDLYDEMIFIPNEFEFKNNIDICYKYRNVNSVASSDIAIFIGGRWGTLNEFSNAYDMGKIIGVVVGSGGISEHFQHLLNIIEKKSKSIVIFSKDPKTIISETIDVFNKQKKEAKNKYDNERTV